MRVLVIGESRGVPAYGNLRMSPGSGRQRGARYYGMGLMRRAIRVCSAGKGRFPIDEERKSS